VLLAILHRNDAFGNTNLKCILADLGRSESFERILKRANGGIKDNQISQFERKSFWHCFG
jgi:hypothetical protein